MDKEPCLNLKKLIQKKFKLFGTNDLAYRGPLTSCKENKVLLPWEKKLIPKKSKLFGTNVLAYCAHSQVTKKIK